MFNDNGNVFRIRDDLRCRYCVCFHRDSWKGPWIGSPLSFILDWMRLTKLVCAMQHVCRNRMVSQKSRSIKFFISSSSVLWKTPSFFTFLFHSSFRKGWDLGNVFNVFLILLYKSLPLRSARSPVWGAKPIERFCTGVVTGEELMFLDFLLLAGGPPYLLNGIICRHCNQSQNSSPTSKSWVGFLACCWRRKIDRLWRADLQYAFNITVSSSNLDVRVCGWSDEEWMQSKWSSLVSFHQSLLLIC